jgi:hypothetical protein
MFRGKNNRRILGRGCARSMQIGLTFTIFASATPVWAQRLTPPDNKSDGKSEGREDAKYRDTLKDALAEYDARHFEEARILFRRAHELNPNARTLRSIGMASFELRDYVAAVRALSASLVETRKALSPEQRTHVQGLLDRSRMFVDIYTLKITPADAKVLIDGRVPEFEADGTLFLGFGPHNLEARKSGYVLRTFTVNVRGGERKELAMTLERKPSDIAQLPPKPAQWSEPPAVSRSGLAPAGWHPGTGWLLAAGGLTLVAGAATVGWLTEQSEITTCGAAQFPRLCDNKDAITSRRNLYVGASAVAGAAAVTMAVIGIVDWLGPRQRPAIGSSVACSVFPAGLICGRAF